MKAAVISFVLLPLLLMAWTRSRFGFRILHTLVASVVGEVLGLLLYASYKQEKVALILSGKASGAVAYVGTDAPRGMAEAFSSCPGSESRLVSWCWQVTGYTLARDLPNERCS